MMLPSSDKQDLSCLLEIDYQLDYLVYDDGSTGASSTAPSTSSSTSYGTFSSLISFVLKLSKVVYTINRE